MLRDLLALGARRCVGVDLPGPWLDVARAGCPGAKFCPIEQVGALPADFSHSFDVVLLLETLEHLPPGSEHTVLASLCHALQPGGRLVLSVPASGLPRLLDPAWYLTGHRHYSLRRLRKLFAKAGFLVVEYGYYGGFGDWVGTMRHYAQKHLKLPERSCPRTKALPTVPTLQAGKRRGILAQSVWLTATPQKHS